MPKTKENFDTKTFMLPDWELSLQKKMVDKTLLYAELHSARTPYEVIGYLRNTLLDVRKFLDSAKPTKQETFYGGE